MTFIIWQNLVSEFDIFPNNFKSVYKNEIVNSSDKLQALYFFDLFTNYVGEIKCLDGKFYLERILLEYSVKLGL